MKDECEIRIMKAELEAKLKNLKRECSDLGISTIESQLTFSVMEEKIKLLDEILGGDDNFCYG